MIHDQGDLTIRPLASGGELELFCTLRYTLDDELADDLADGRRRPEWMWVALRGGALVARAACWGPAGADVPAVLDVLDVADASDRVDIGVRLVNAALGEIIPQGTDWPEYIRFVPPDWREHASSRRVVEDLMTIARQAGARLLVERFRFEWRPGTPIAAPTGRIAFRPVASDAEIIDLMTLALDGTLDAHSRQTLSQMPAREGAIQHFEDELAKYSSPRDWWRIATLPDGEPVGFVIPARNDYGAIIAYIGVLPSHRGNGYINELLAEGTRLLAACDVPRIRAATDLANAPMAQAFTRAGWVNFERSINMTWSARSQWPQ